MSKAEEKNVSHVRLQGTLSRIGLQNTTAAKLAVELLGGKAITSATIDSVTSLVETAVLEQKKKFQASVEKIKT